VFCIWNLRIYIALSRSIRINIGYAFILYFYYRYVFFFVARMHITPYSIHFLFCLFVCYTLSVEPSSTSLSIIVLRCSLEQAVETLTLSYILPKKKCFDHMFSQVVRGCSWIKIKRNENTEKSYRDDSAKRKRIESNK
jgi:hypothetical protein